MRVAPDVKTNALSEPRLFTIVMDDAQTPVDPNMVNNARAIARGIVDNLSPSGLAAVIFTKDNRNCAAFRSGVRVRLAGWRSGVGVRAGRVRSGVGRA